MNAPFKILTTPEGEKAAKIIIQSAICNYDKWEKGEEDLRYKIGNSELSNLQIIVQNYE